MSDESNGNPMEENQARIHFRDLLLGIDYRNETNLFIIIILKLNCVQLLT